MEHYTEFDGVFTPKREKVTLMPSEWFTGYTLAVVVLAVVAVVYAATWPLAGI